MSRKLRQKRRRAIRGRAGRTPTWAIALGPAVVLHGVRCVVRAEGFEVTDGSRVQEFEWYFHLACQCARHRGTKGHRGVPHVLAESVAVKQAGCGRGGLPSVLWRDRGTNGPITRPCSRRLGPPLRSGPPAAEGHGVRRTANVLCQASGSGCWCQATRTTTSSMRTASPTATAQKRAGRPWSDGWTRSEGPCRSVRPMGVAMPTSHPDGSAAPGTLASSTLVWWIWG